MKTTMKTRRLSVFLAGLLAVGAFVPAARAALFCAQSAGGTPECVFDDARACRKRAVEMGGSCTVNREALLDVGVGASPVCLVYGPTVVQCVYNDFTTCNRAAVRNNAACVNISSVQVFEETPGGVINSQKPSESTAPAAPR